MDGWMDGWIMNLLFYTENAKKEEETPQKVSSND